MQWKKVTNAKVFKKFNGANKAYKLCSGRPAFSYQRKWHMFYQNLTIESKGY